MTAAGGGARSIRVGTGTVLGVVLVATATIIALQGGSGGACHGAVSMKIVASPAIAPTIQEIVKRDVDASCIVARVAPQNAADVATELAGDTGETPALWLPDSSLWPKRARQEAASQGGTPARIEEHAPLVISPLVAVTARKDAAKLGWPNAQVGWQELVGGQVPTMIGDPLSTTEGLVTLLVVQRLLAAGDGTLPPDLVTALLKLGHNAVPTVQAGYDKLTAATGTLAFTASEQSVIAHNRAAGREAVVAIYPKDGTVALDYPVVRVTTPDEPRGLADAAETVEAALRTPGAVQSLQEAGFRDPDGVLGDLHNGMSGVVRSKPTLVALPSVKQSTEMLRTWGMMTLDARLLVLIDVSASMDANAGNGHTRIQLARDAALRALRLYPDSIDVGLWAFSVRQSPPHDWTELVPIGLVTDDLGGMSRRQALQAALTSLPDRTKGATGLNDTVLAAFRAQRNTYDAGRTNSILVLTDGRNEDANGISDEDLLHTLRAEADPSRPVSIIPIGMGPDVDLPALQKIAAATGGKAYLARNPADIRDVFLDAIVERRCHPTC
jgi:von Willebrand factor type A domain